MRPLYLSAIDWKQLINHRLTRTIPYWIAAVAVGLTATAYAQIFYYVSKWTEKLFMESPRLIFLIAPTSFFVGWFLVRYFAPNAGGSGIPQVLVAINLNPEESAHEISALLKLKVTFVKILSSVLCLLGGGAIGREGPTLQISASIFHFIGSKARGIWKDSDYSSWIIAGGAAGIASAFNTPLGGIVYAMEELSSTHFHKFKMAALSAVIVSGVIAQAFLGSYLYLGYPKIGLVTLSILPVALIVGLLSGGVGGVFGKALFYCSNFVRTMIPKERAFLVPLLTGFALAAISYFIDRRAIGSGSGINSDLLSGNAIHSGVTLVGARFLSTVLSYLSGCAGGIFAPSLAIGASIGAEVSKFIGRDHENLLILLGMIGFLTAVTHCPFTSLVLIMEMTDRHSAIFPMMLSALAAHGIAKSIDSKSFYEKARMFYLPKPHRIKSSRKSDE